MSTNGNTAVVDPFVGRSAEEHPWVSALPLPSREERRRGLLAPVTTPVGRKQRPKLAYAAVAVAALVLVVIAQLALSIAVSNGAYKINSLQQQQRQVGRAYQAASEAASRLSSPQNLAVNASALGMVANGTPVYLRLSNGKVIGSPQPAAGAKKYEPEYSNTADITVSYMARLQREKGPLSGPLPVVRFVKRLHGFVHFFPDFLVHLLLADPIVHEAQPQSDHGR
ncbi:MAG: hypothetical protein FWF16_11950, partial [Microbacteriaceae bacterium]|nr:hypothetical protein [Microbacteriaceae bacterium]